MEIPTIEAVDAVKEFTEDLQMRVSLFLCLSELPIGDEYEVLTPSDHYAWKEFEIFLSGRKIKAWKNYPFNSEDRKVADKYLRDEYAAAEKALKAVLAS